VLARTIQFSKNRPLVRPGRPTDSVWSIRSGFRVSGPASTVSPGWPLPPVGGDRV